MELDFTATSAPASAPRPADIPAQRRSVGPACLLPADIQEVDRRCEVLGSEHPRAPSLHREFVWLHRGVKWPGQSHPSARRNAYGVGMIHKVRGRMRGRLHSGQSPVGPHRPKSPRPDLHSEQDGWDNTPPWVSTGAAGISAGAILGTLGICFGSCAEAKPQHAAQLRRQMQTCLFNIVSPKLGTNARRSSHPEGIV